MSADTQTSDKTRGWLIVAAMLVVQTVSSGLGFYNMSVYMSEFAAELARPLSDLSLAVSLFFVTGGVCGILVARLIGRVDIRWIMIGGALISGLALAAMSGVSKLWQVYLLFVIFGAGNTGVSLVVATTLITRWFPGSNRSIALSIASTGLSLGGVTLTPVSAWLFNNSGAFESMPLLGLIFVAVILPVAFFVVRLPAAEVDESETPQESEESYQRARRTRFFVMLALGYIFCMGAQVGGIAHLYGRVDLLGGYASASLAVQVLSVCSILGRFAGGVIVTRLPVRVFTLSMLWLQAAGLVVLGLAETPVVAVIGAALFGLSVGNLLMSQPLWLAEAFPGQLYPRVFALAHALSVIGVAFGPYGMGVGVDAGGYITAFGAAAVFSLLAFGTMLAAGRQPIYDLPEQPAQSRAL